MVCTWRIGERLPTILRPKLPGDDPLTTEVAGPGEYDLALVREVLVQNDAQMRSVEELGE
jgi:hypothetical protein